MDYRIKELAELSGVSARTLRYYDQIGLLKPERQEENGYRIYGKQQVDRLQQILFYRQLGMPLEKIRKTIDSPGYDRNRALEEHLAVLRQQQEELSCLIRNVEKTICSLKGECSMSDREKFEGFKQELIRKNNEQYGEEVIAQYGQENLDESNRKLSDMSEKQWQDQQELSERIFDLLEAAMEKQDPACAEALEAAECHRQWLCLFWKDGLYNKQTHRALAEMYVADERFTAFYEKRLGKGAAGFLKEAIYNYTK